MEARALVAALPPEPLATSSLAEAVGRLVHRTGEELALDADYRVEGTPRRLSPAVEVTLLRVAQEALSNVRKHARARAVTVVLGFAAGTVTLSVADDGVGFDPDTGRGGFGLSGMPARVEQAGGRFALGAAPTGTEVWAEVPG